MSRSNPEEPMTLAEAECWLAACETRALRYQEYVASGCLTHRYEFQSATADLAVYRELGAAQREVARLKAVQERELVMVATDPRR